MRLRPAVDRHHGARRHLVLLRAQKRDRPRDILGLDPVLMLGLGHRLAIRLGVDRAWRDRIDEHVIGHHLFGQRRGEGLDRALGDRVCGELSRAGQSGARGDRDDPPVFILDRKSVV